jgi:hypothetical protein
VEVQTVVPMLAAAMEKNGAVCDCITAHVHSIVTSKYMSLLRTHIYIYGNDVYNMDREGISQQIRSCSSLHKLKEQCNRDALPSVFFHQTIPPWVLIHRLNPIRIRFRICRENRYENRQNWIPRCQ